MDLKLKVLRGTNAGQEVTVTSQKFLIGRAEDCHLRPGSEMISRHHCAIIVDQSYVAIRDFGSKNGTFVNDQRVVGECAVKSGDQLRVGPLEFEITLLTGELGGKKKPPVHNPRQAAERTAAGQSEEPDIAQWLADPTSETPGVESQRLAAFETQSTNLSETRHSASPPAPSVAASPVVAPPQAPPEAANVPRRAPPSTFQMPDPEPPVPVADDTASRSDRKKVFGKLPVQPKHPDDTRSAASDLLDKLRKRR